MAKLTCISSDSFLTEWKARIYYTGHPSDCARFFPEVRDALTACCPCEIYYDEEPEQPLTQEQQQSQLRNMNLMILPVTMALLSSPNAAMDQYVPFAQAHHIPILPILVSPGIAPASTLPHKFGKLPYVDMADRQERHLTFREELGEQLQRILPEKSTILLVETLLSGKAPSKEPLPNGLAALYGIGRDISSREAEQLLLRAATEQSATAMECLYKMYDRGIGVPMNLPLALEWAAKLSAHYRKKENIPLWTSRLRYLSQLCDTFRRKGDATYAAKLAFDLTALCRDALGSHHAHTQRCIRLEADLALENLDMQRLLLLRRQLQRHSRQQLGQTDPATLGDLLRLARGHERLGEKTEAIRRLEELQTFSIQAENPTMAATALYRLACICNTDNRFADGLTLIERCIDLRRTTQGSVHADTLQALQLRSSLLSSLERTIEALNLRRMVNNRYRRTLGPLHPLTLEAQTLLAIRLHSMGRYTESLRHIERAYRSYECFYGPDFVRTKMARNMYERIKRDAEESD